MIDAYVDASIDNAHLADNAVDTAEIADNAVTLAKMDGLARGTLIYGDASGDPAALAAGGADEVLTHDGTDLAWAAAGGFDVSSITGATALAEQPAATDEIVLSDAGTLKRLDIKHIQATPSFFVSLASNATVTDNTITKVDLDTEALDSDGTFASGAFTPAVAGYYYIFANIAWSPGNAFRWEGGHAYLYKNGSIYLASSDMFQDFRTEEADSGGLTISAIISLDADDYVELYGKLRTGDDENGIVYGGRTSMGGFRLTGV